VNAVMIYLPVHFFAMFLCKSHHHPFCIHVESWSAAGAAFSSPKSIKNEKILERADLTTSMTPRLDNHYGRQYEAKHNKDQPSQPCP
jgi:hypothetical protein